MRICTVSEWGYSSANCGIISIPRNLPPTALEMVCVLWKCNVQYCLNFNCKNTGEENKVFQIKWNLRLKKYMTDIFFLCATSLSWPIYYFFFGVRIKRRIWENGRELWELHCFQYHALGQEAGINVENLGLQWESLQNSSEWEKPAGIYGSERWVSQSLRRN